MKTKVTLLWNQKGKTDRAIHNDKLDIITRNNKKGTYMLIDVANLGDRNVMKKEASQDSYIPGIYKFLVRGRSGEELCSVAPNIFGFSLWNILDVIFLVLRIWMWLLGCQKPCEPLL
jgi:hypothetical protein